jgi:hypothetical protein
MIWLPDQGSNLALRHELARLEASSDARTGGAGPQTYDRPSAMEMAPLRRIFDMLDFSGR